jgi:hypothetical protein
MGPTCPSAVHKRCQRGAGQSMDAQQFDAEASLRAALNFAPPVGLAAGAYVSYCHALRQSRFVSKPLSRARPRAGARKQGASSGGRPRALLACVCVRGCVDA